MQQTPLFSIVDDIKICLIISLLPLLREAVRIPFFLKGGINYHGLGNEESFVSTD
ncbi:hypothetical protein KsCSTR_20360 [Candidatus Kuenenia stuttgartiensis]|uniref:Uncharacterized protein n=1 Tax=Kuenenia stuttgartiensis TaxID=174633 RepID=A0A2C9CEG7_KUEST|nr:hypothetical protein KsCSTR_20360 [Candidatus Kuenenia stuttgartiensis]SOH03137.1 hypothetical protein KSMBR1_0623 [Candidatus Kuenenia stuttgartiensis]